MPLTLEEFRASKVWHDCLDAANVGADDVLSGGYVYDKVCYIEKWSNGWGLIIENREWHNQPLEELEEILYREWYVTEICAQDARVRYLDASTGFIGEEGWYFGSPPVGPYETEAEAWADRPR